MQYASMQRHVFQNISLFYLDKFNGLESFHLDSYRRKEKCIEVQCLKFIKENHKNGLSNKSTRMFIEE